MLTEYGLDVRAQIESTSRLVLDLIEENKLICALSYQIVECNTRVLYSGTRVSRARCHKKS